VYRMCKVQRLRFPSTKLARYRDGPDMSMYLYKSFSESIVPKNSWNKIQPFLSFLNDRELSLAYSRRSHDLSSFLHQGRFLSLVAVATALAYIIPQLYTTQWQLPTLNPGCISCSSVRRSRCSSFMVSHRRLQGASGRFILVEASFRAF
jgi:hypothetical protein